LLAAVPTRCFVALVVFSVFADTGEIEILFVKFAILVAPIVVLEQCIYFIGFL
jgi:hypothetical protein